MPLFPTLPDDARIWLHATNRRLRPSEEAVLRKQMNMFFAEWTSHGRSIEAGFRIEEGQIVVIAAHIPDGDISGCGIDKLVHRLEKIAAGMDFEWAGPLDILYRDTDGMLRCTSRAAFQEMVRDGSVNGSTPILDLSPTQLGDVRDHGIEKEAQDGWAAKAFSFPAA